MLRIWACLKALDRSFLSMYCYAFTLSVSRANLFLRLDPLMCITGPLSPSTGLSRTWLLLGNP